MQTKTKIEKPRRLERGLPTTRVNVLRQQGGLRPLPEPDLLTIQQTMWKLSVGKEAIKWYVKQGILHPVRLSERRIRYSRAELERLLKEAGL